MTPFYRPLTLKASPDFAVSPAGVHESVERRSAAFEKGSAVADEAGSSGAYSPHLAPASEMLERLRRRDAKYLSTKGAPLIRGRLPGVSRREKSAYAILLRGTLFSP
jgi:hypothetical protein